MSGINLVNLQEAFVGSEDVLVQMLALFQVQARERLQQLGEHLAHWDELAARPVLHSLVNIAGAVRAFGMSDLAKTVGEAIKRGDKATARSAGQSLNREGELVLAQVEVLLAAAKGHPESIWSVALPGLDRLSSAER